MGIKNPDFRFSIKATLCLLTTLLTAPVFAATSSGIDTPTGSTDMPFAIQGTQIMDLSATGLGINTLTANDTLDVNGGIHVEGVVFPTGGAGLELGYGSPAGTTFIQSYSRAASTWLPGYIDAQRLSLNSQSGGVVGIGTVTPFAPLDVRTGADQRILFRGPISGSSGTSIGSVNDVNNTWESLEIDGSVTIMGMAGNVGVGMIAPGQKVVIYGPNNNWGLNVNYGNGAPQYGVLAQGSIWAGYFVGPVVITSGFLQFPDGTQQTTAYQTGHAYGGTYTTTNGGCSTGNPWTGNCSCPGGYGAYTTFNQYAGCCNPYNWYTIITCEK